MIPLELCEAQFTKQNDLLLIRLFAGPITRVTPMNRRHTCQITKNIYT
jgi:hypothetical protein